MIGRNSIILAFFTGCSLFLGVIRDRLLATYVGIGPTLDVYNAAFRLPDFLFGIMLAFVTAGTVVPFLLKDSQSQAHDPRKKLSSISLFYVFGMGVLAIIIAITLPWYAKYLVPGFNSQDLDLYIDATRLLLLQPILLGLASLVSCFAQMKNDFLMYGIAPLTYNSSIIVGTIFYYPIYGFKSLMVAVTVGALVSLVLHLYGLRKAKLHEVFLHFNWHHIKGLFHVAYPRSGTNVITQVSHIAMTAFATSLGAGVLTSYLFAMRIGDAAISLVNQSLGTASLPVLTRDVVMQNYHEHRRLVRKYVTILTVVGTLSALVIYIFGEQLVSLMYGNTSYNKLILYFLTAFAIIIPFRMIGFYLVIAFYSMSDTKTVFIGNLLAHSGAVLLAYILLPIGIRALFYAVLFAPIFFYLYITLAYRIIYFKKEKEEI